MIVLQQPTKLTTGVRPVSGGACANKVTKPTN